jgi:hypothetical protein
MRHISPRSTLVTFQKLMSPDCIVLYRIVSYRVAWSMCSHSPEGIVLFVHQERGNRTPRREGVALSVHQDCTIGESDRDQGMHIESKDGSLSNIMWKQNAIVKDWNKSNQAILRYLKTFSLILNCSFPVVEIRRESEDRWRRLLTPRKWKCRTWIFCNDHPFGISVHRTIFGRASLQLTTNDLAYGGCWLYGRAMFAFDESQKSMDFLIFEPS